MKETKIIKVNEEETAGKKLYSVATHTVPFSKDFEGWCDHIEGSFLFEPTPHWILRKWSLKYWKATGQPHISVSCSVDYKEPIEDVPILRSVQHESWDDKGNLGRGYKADIKLVKFGPVSADEFTLSGCGVKGHGGDPEDKPAPWLSIFLCSTGVVILALVLIRTLRRRMAKTPQPTR